MERDATDASSTSSYDTEAEIDEVILRLDLTLVIPDHEDPIQENSADDAPLSNGIQNGGTHTTTTSKFNGEKATAGKSQPGSSGNNQHEDDKKRSKPLDFIRKLRQTGFQTDRNGTSSDSASRRKSPEPLKVGQRVYMFTCRRFIL